MKIHEFVWPKDRIDHIARHAVSSEEFEMEKTMNTIRIPNTDSIAELAEFWDNHDLTDFEDQLEEVTEPVFVRKKAIRIPLASKEINAIRNIAKSKGIGSEELIRKWVLEKIHV